MACEADDEGSPIETMMPMQTVGSTLLTKENEGTYTFVGQAPCQLLPSQTAHLMPRAEASTQSMLQVMQPALDVPRFVGFGQVPFNQNQVMYGSLQGLLNSFCSKIPERGTSGSFAGQMNESMNNFNGYYYQSSALEQDGNGTIASESPQRIDESGYESSGSSVYDVLSEDEECNNNIKGIPVDQDDGGNNNIDAE